MNAHNPSRAWIFVDRSKTPPRVVVVIAPDEAEARDAVWSWRSGEDDPQLTLISSELLSRSDIIVDTDGVADYMTGERVKL